MRIGLDFDNTIVGYDHLFVPTAVSLGWLTQDFAGGKTMVRDALRAKANGELRWQKLQAEIYGRRMPEALMIPGVREFLELCRERGVELSIVSHKTEHPAADPSLNLRQAARDWMAANDLFAFVPPERIFFEGSRESKIARIEELEVESFVDDLEEIFRHPDFPPSIRRLLLAPDGSAPGPFEVFATWSEISDAIFAA
jgi:hypothetical protein